MKAADITSLADTYMDAVYGFCLHLTGNTYEAEELCQNTFLKALERASHIDENNNPRAYLFAISVSLHKSHKRKLARRFAIAPQSALDETLASSERIDEAAEKKELHAKVRSEIAKLEEKLRVPIILYYLYDLGISEISAIVKCPEGTVKSRLHAARSFFNNYLEVHVSEI